jgi:hypothetical protein
MGMTATGQQPAGALAGMIDHAIAVVEERLLWNRFGL